MITSLQQNFYAYAMTDFSQQQQQQQKSMYEIERQMEQVQMYVLLSAFDKLNDNILASFCFGVDIRSIFLRNGHIYLFNLSKLLGDIQDQKLFLAGFKC